MPGISFNRANALTTWNLTLDRAPEFGRHAVHEFRDTAPPDSYGVVYGRRPYVRGRGLTLEGLIVGTTTQNREDNEASLSQALEGRLVRIEFDTGTTWKRVAWGYKTAFDSAPVQKSFLSIASRVSIAFVCPDGAWSDEEPLPFGFDDTPTALGLVWAPTAPVWRIMGPAVNPVLNLFGVNGQAIASSTFNVTLGANDYLEMDARTGRLELSSAGTWSDAIAILAGDSPPLLDPLDADPVNGLAHLAAVTDGTGLAHYPLRKT